MENYSEEQEVSLVELLSALISKWWIIAISAMICCVAAFTVSELVITPKYTSTGSLYVSGSKMATSELNYNQTLLAQSLVNTYSEILKSNTALTIVSEDLDGKYSPAQLQGMISLEGVEDTEILYVHATADNSRDSFLIASSLLKNAPGILTEIVNGGDVKIVDEAVESISPSSPNVMKNTAIGLLAGIVIGCIIVFALNMFDTRIKSAAEITDKYQLPVLGKIPSLGSDKQ